MSSAVTVCDRVAKNVVPQDSSAPSTFKRAPR
jgi:hypothetical protein